MASRELKVEIIGDSRSLEKALGSATKSAGSFGSKTSKAFKMVGLAAAGAGVAVAGGFIYTLKRGFDELGDSQKVMAQTAAVIKSTGGAAKVSADQVEGWAEELSKITGVDDEVIASGENMLLTFTNIRNETGKGNDVFRQATNTLLDMSTALGTDMNKSAIQLGKALNDPIKGITALQRVGVSFTEGQKKTIASLVESGNVMGAQKMILAELNKEFGGSAAAFGETMPGQLAKLKNAFDEVAGNLAVKFLPMLTTLVAWVNDNWASIAAVFDAVGRAVIASFNAIGTAVTWLRGQWEIHRESAIAAWEAVRDAVLQFISWFQTNVVPPIRSAIAGAIAIWDNFGGEIKTIGNAMITFVKTWIQNMVAPIRIALALLRGDWSEAWNELKATVSRTLGAALSIIRGLIGAFVSAAVQIGQGILRGIGEGMVGIAAKVAEGMQRVWDALRSAATTAYNFAKQIGSKIVSGIWDGFKGLIGGIKDKIADAIGGLVSGIDIPGFSPPEAAGAKAIGEPLAEGVGTGFVEKMPSEAKRMAQAIAASAVQIKAATKVLGGEAVQEIINGIAGKQPSLVQQLQTALATAVEAGRQAVITAKAGYAAAFASLFDAGAAAIAAKYAGWTPPALLRAQREAEAREAKKLVEDIKAARDAVAKALAAEAALPPQRMGEGMSEERRKAEADILAAQASLDDLLFQKEQKRLADLAVEQQKARDKMVADEQADFRTRLEKIAASGKNINEKVMALLKSFDIDYLLAGKKWGNQLAQGLRDAKDAVRDAARELAQVTKDNLEPKKSPAKEGPLSTFDMYDAGRQFGMDWAGGMASAAKSAGKAAGSVAGRAAGALGGRTGGPGGIGSSGRRRGEQTFDEAFSIPKPAWADEEIWGAAVGIAVKEKRGAEFAKAIEDGAFKSNAGLLDQINRRRTRLNWNQFTGRLAGMLDMMKPPDGMSGRQVADFFGLLDKGGIITRPGMYASNTPEAVIPLNSSLGRSALGRDVVINFNGPVLGTEEQLTRKIIEGIRREQKRGAPTITRGS